MGDWLRDNEMISREKRKENEREDGRDRPREKKENEKVRTDWTGSLFGDKMVRGEPPLPTWLVLLSV